MKRTIKVVYTMEIKQEWDGANFHYQVHIKNKPFPNKRPDMIWHSIVPGNSIIECLTKATKKINEEFKYTWESKDYEYDQS